MGLLHYRVEHFGALIWALGIVHTCKHLTLPDGPASLHHSTQSMSLFGHGGFNSQQRRMLFIYGTTPSAFAVHSSTFRIVFTVACMPVYLCDCEKNKTFFSQCLTVRSTYTLTGQMKPNNFFCQKGPRMLQLNGRV